MIQELTIHNFAVIDRAQVRWSPGLNVITGETGAGKSILIDAVGAMLGDRLGPEVVRSGAERALVEGVFVLHSDPSPELQTVFDEYGVEPEDGALIVSREIAGGAGRTRGSARINGRSMPLSVLQALGELLVDVHGQSEHMALLRAREQLEYLDRYAGALDARAQVAALVKELRATRDARQAMLAAERESARLQDRLRHELAEIERAELAPDEEADLLAQRTRLEHVEGLRQSALRAYAALRGDDTDRTAAVDLLSVAAAACDDGARFDSTLAEHAESIASATALAEDAARSLRSYLDAIEADPEALERTTERLFLIGDLKRRYGDTVSDVLSYALQAREQLQELERREDRVAELDHTERRLLSELGTSAETLSAARTRAAAELAAAAERELADLRLGGATFAVSVTQTDDPQGVPIDSRTVAFDATGIDRVAFLITTNPGEPPRPMARVASGGELSRIALALKTILARAETRPTLIFDEIDVGIGGRTGPVVGEKLWRIASAGHQVLCVTHMPQVAAFADAHYAVLKDTTVERAETRVVALDQAARVDELAAMLAGAPTDAARRSARELLQRAESVKRTAP